MPLGPKAKSQLEKTKAATETVIGRLVIGVVLLAGVAEAPETGRSALVMGSPRFKEPGAPGGLGLSVPPGGGSDSSCQALPRPYRAGRLINSHLTHRLRFAPPVAKRLRPFGTGPGAPGTRRGQWRPMAKTEQSAGAASPNAAEGTAGDQPAAARRIIALAPSTAEIIFALGAGDSVVGVSPYATYPPEVKKLAQVGGVRDPDLETILALRPDLVILRGKNHRVEQLCRQHDIRVFCDETTTLGSVFETIEALGRVLGKTDRAAEVGAELRRRLEAVRQAAGSQDRPGVLLTLRTPDKLGPITTVAKGSYLHELIELAGGRNVFGELEVAYPEVALEEILARQPEIIIEAMPGESIDEQRRSRLADQWKAVGRLKAVETGRIHYLTEDYVLIPSPRASLLAEKLRAIFAEEGAKGQRDREERMKAERRTQNAKRRRRKAEG